jgi:shikimate 5-dehydrogenase
MAAIMELNLVRRSLRFDERLASCFTTCLMLIKHEAHRQDSLQRVALCAARRTDICLTRRYANAVVAYRTDRGFGYVIASPEVTPLLAMAMASGCRTVGGKTMLSGQLTELERFFGIGDEA